MAMLLFFTAIPGVYILYPCFVILGFVFLPVSLCAATALVINTPLPVRAQNARLVAGLSLALNLLLFILLRYALPAWALRGWILYLLAPLPSLGAALKADNYSTAFLYGAWPAILLLVFSTFDVIFGHHSGGEVGLGHMVGFGMSVIYFLVTIAGVSAGYFFNWLTTPMETS